MNTFPNKWAHLNCEWSIANVKVVQTNNVNIWCLAVYLALYWRRWTGYRFFGPPRACQPACVCVCARLLRESSGRRQFCPAAYLARHRLHSRPPSSQVSARTHTHTHANSQYTSHIPPCSHHSTYFTHCMLCSIVLLPAEATAVLFSASSLSFFLLFYRSMLYSNGAVLPSHDVRPSVCLSVCLSIRPWRWWILIAYVELGGILLHG